MKRKLLALSLSFSVMLTLFGQSPATIAYASNATPASIGSEVLGEISDKSGDLLEPDITKTPASVSKDETDSLLDDCDVNEKKVEKAYKKAISPNQSDVTTSDSNPYIKYSSVYDASYNWDKFSTNFMYNQLSTDEKKVYDLMDLACYQLLTTTEDAPNTGSYHRTPYVSYDGITYNAAAKALISLYYDNPQYYFLQMSLYMNRTHQTISFAVYDNFADGDARSAATEKFRTNIESMVSTINGQSTPSLKAAKANDLICYNSKYNYAFANESDYSTQMDIEQRDYTQSAYSSIVGGNPVCAGYGMGYAAIMNAAGIDTIPVISDVHLWNIVRINDQWYHVDTCWNDSESRITYLFFLRNDSNIKAYDGGNKAHDATIGEAYGTAGLFYPACKFDVFTSYYTPGTALAFDDKAQTPQASFVESNGKYLVTLASNADHIYYTLDGNEPDIASKKSFIYSGPVSVSASQTLKAVADCGGCLDSDVCVWTKDSMQSQFDDGDAANDSSSDSDITISDSDQDSEIVISDGGTSDESGETDDIVIGDADDNDSIDDITIDDGDDAIEEGNDAVEEEHIQHTWVEANRKAATCTKDGYQNYICSVCGEERSEVIPATGHSYKVTKSSEATCTRAGYVMHRCDNCGDTYKETTPALGHDYEVVSHTDATCTSSGRTVYMCKHCHRTETERVRALGHQWSDWAVTQEATVFRSGRQEHKCEHGGKIQVKTISRLRPTGKLSVTQTTLRKGESFTLNVSDLANGDYVVAWRTSHKTRVGISDATASSVLVTGETRTGTATVTCILASGKTIKCTVKVK